MRRMLHALVLALALAVDSISYGQSASRPRIVRFPADKIDFVGFCNWEAAGALASDTATARKSLVEGRYLAAYQQFKRAWQARHSDFAALHGLVLSAQKLKSLPSLLVEIENEQAQLRLKGGEIPSELLFATFYGCKVAAYFAIWCSDKASVIPDDSPAKYYYYQANAKLKPLTFRDKRYAIMYTSALYAADDIAETRRSARLQISEFRTFPELKLLLAKSCTTGTLELKRGGHPVPVPEDEKVDQKEWLRLSREVVAEAPTLWVAYYEAGLACASSNAPESIRYLKTFLDHEPQGTPRFNWAQQTLARLNHSRKV